MSKQKVMKNHEWISVHDRLPIDDSPVLVYSPDLAYSNRNVWIDSYSPHRKRFALNSVSHWMPLPEPPSKP